VIYAVLWLALLLFTLSVKHVGVVPRVRWAVTELRGAVQVLRSESYGDEAKEAMIQKSALGMVGALASITGRSVLALAIPLVFVALGAFLGLYTREAVLEVASDATFVAVTSAAMLLLWFLIPSPVEPRVASADQRRGQEIDRYNSVDRALHQVAFRSLGAQKALADLESRVYAQRLAAIELQRPVFVSSLPRAGTTLLLEVLSNAPDFAVATYRSMPFALCPLLWDRVSRGLRKPGELRERAHGDGMVVSYDSPEAFEEVVWKSGWEARYQADRLRPWGPADRDPDFEVYLQDYMRKVVALSGRPGARYLSKNNANIARLTLLPRLFPDSRIVVPVRNPYPHAASLAQQHARFLEIHAQDRFARSYMEWLGHYEFGAALRPIDFNGWLDEPDRPSPAMPEFWLRYWLAAYSALASQAGDQVLFVDYEALCANPSGQLRALGENLGLAEPSALATQGSRFRAPPAPPAPDPSLDLELRRSLSALHTDLTERAIGGVGRVSSAFGR